jgi:hypothetical protein
MLARWPGRVLAVGLLVISLNACATSGSSAVAPASLLGSGTARHASVNSQQSGTSPCGTCSCNEGGGAEDPTDDQGDPCGGSGNSGTGAQAGGTPVDSLPPSVDTLPPQPNCSATPAPAMCQLAAKPGAPSGSCQQTDGSSSLSIGTSLGPVNKDGKTTVRSVIDVNQVNAAVNPQIVNNQMVVGSWEPVGWIYLDNNGGSGIKRTLPPNGISPLTSIFQHTLGFR